MLRLYYKLQQIEFTKISEIIRKLQVAHQLQRKAKRFATALRKKALPTSCHTDPGTLCLAAHLQSAASKYRDLETHAQL
jgi:hypothetical protein